MFFSPAADVALGALVLAGHGVKERLHRHGPDDRDVLDLQDRLAGVTQERADGRK
jgi:hypothetical protein